MDDYYTYIINGGGFNDWLEPVDSIGGLTPWDPVPNYKIEYRTETLFISFPKDKDGKGTGYCKVKWDQEPPYNYYAPFCRSENQRAVAGCVAIAMAQVMSVHKWPEEYVCHMNSRETYNWLKEGDDEALFNRRSEDYFEKIIGNDPTAVRVRLDWDLIIGAGSGNPSKVNIGSDMRASLIRDIGYKLGNEWGVKGTIADSKNAKGTFSRMGYKHGIAYTDTNIDDIYSEIKAGRPCVLRGHDNGNGHAWVVHGVMTKIIRGRYYRVYPDGREELHSSTVYDSQSRYLLLNFGWGGTADGYYIAGNYNTRKGPDDKDPTGGGGIGDYSFDRKHRFTWKIEPINSYNYIELNNQ